MHNSYNLILLILTVFVFNSCKNEPKYSNIPTIEWRRFSTAVVQQYYGQTKMVFYFTDGDGNIGALEQDTLPDVIITDRRNGAEFQYRIPLVPQEGGSKSISGEIEIDIGTFCCIATGCLPDPNGTLQEATTLNVKIRDQSNNWSNEIETDSIYITCY